jgi:hypothetical protein
VDVDFFVIPSTTAKGPLAGDSITNWSSDNGKTIMAGNVQGIGLHVEACLDQASFHSSGSSNSAFLAVCSGSNAQRQADLFEPPVQAAWNRFSLERLQRIPKPSC